MQRFFFGLGILLVTWSSAFAGKVVLHGKAPDYAGQKIEFQTYENQLTYKEITLCTTTVSRNGEFSCSLDLNGITYVFTRPGVYFAFVYAEPGYDYTLQLPPRKDKLPGEKINPYFEEEKVHLSIRTMKTLKGGNETKPELNERIRQFDALFDSLYAEYSLNAYVKTHNNNIDSLTQALDSRFAHSGIAYFDEYYHYRIGQLKFMSSRFKSRHISDNYFLNRPILYDNPAYMELFNQVYEKYFVYFGRTPSGKVIFDDINSAKSLTRLMATLRQDQVLSNDTLRELVMMKGIHDGFYEMNFSRNALLQILDSLHATTQIPLHREICENIRGKVTRLLPGYDPPAFRLLNQDSVWVSNQDLKGTLTYLVFCTTQNYVCFKEFDQLKKIQQKYGNLLNIVTISVDDSLQAMRHFYRKYPYKWTFLYYGDQPEVIKDYDIRTFPTYYLIDAEGKMLMSPASSPAENIEVYIFEYLRSKKLI